MTDRVKEIRDLLLSGRFLVAAKEPGRCAACLARHERGNVISVARKCPVICVACIDRWASAIVTAETTPAPRRTGGPTSCKPQRPQPKQIDEVVNDKIARTEKGNDTSK